MMAWLRDVDALLGKDGLCDRDKFFSSFVKKQSGSVGERNARCRFCDSPICNNHSRFYTRNVSQQDDNTLRDDAPYWKQ
jgi:hypothetical protein